MLQHVFFDEKKTARQYKEFLNFGNPRTPAHTFVSRRTTRNTTMMLRYYSEALIREDNSYYLTFLGLRLPVPVVDDAEETRTAGAT